jgi:adenine specific DNA methylase Mod
MRIKSRYYTDGIFPKLKQGIDGALKPFPAFRDELFEKLYDFFHRYFSESGSIYFRYTPLHQNVYEKVYTDDRDVMLFWKTHMLYYVKTDRIFRSMEVELDGRKFIFDVSTLEHKKANEKRDIVYSLAKRRADGVLAFAVAYSEKGEKTNVVEILKALRQNGDKISEDLLERAFRVFEKQSQVDYFINKDAKAFLEEQFNLWLYQYMFSGVSEWTETRIKQLQILKDTAFKIIAFISQFEDELVRIWDKPKFVLDSNYVITLDRIVEKDGGLALVEKLLDHGNFKEQVREWQQLGIVDKSIKKTAILEKDSKGKRLAKSYEHLPVDTKYFKELELSILGLFDSLDQQLDGWLIKSENYQALNTIKNKFHEVVRVMYADPPFNTTEESFIYANRYKHSSWATMMHNRVSIAGQLLDEKGICSVAIDDEEIFDLKHVLDDIFGDDDFIGTLVIESNPRGRTTNAFLATSHEYNLLYAKNITSAEITNVPLTEDQVADFNLHDETSAYRLLPFRRSGGLSTPEERPKSYYPLYLDQSTGKITLEKVPKRLEIWPIDTKGKKRVWRFSIVESSNLRRAIENGDLVAKKTDEGYTIYLKDRIKKGRKPKTIWSESRYDASTHGTVLLQELFGTTKLFSYPKSIFNTQDILAVLTDSNSPDFIVDFFAGSGTTAHATINLNRQDGGRRKYVLVEMADYFDTVLLPRVKKVVFSDKWKNGKAQEGGIGISHFVKYCRLEQYEDALRKAKYAEADLFDDPNKDPFHQYVFLRDLKMLEALEADAEKNKVEVDLSRLYDGVDIAETVSNLTGKWIKRITVNSVEFGDGEVVNTKDLDWKQIKPLIWW